MLPGPPPLHAALADVPPGVQDLRRGDVELRDDAGDVEVQRRRQGAHQGGEGRKVPLPGKGHLPLAAVFAGMSVIRLPQTVMCLTHFYWLARTARS